MPKLEYFLAALSLSQDQRTNLVSLFHVLEQIQCESLPQILPDFVAVSTWHFSEDELGRDFQAAIKIHYPSGQEPHESEALKLNFTPEQVGFHTFFYLRGIEVTAEGLLRLELLLDGEHQADHTVRIMLKEADDS